MEPFEDKIEKRKTANGDSESEEGRKKRRSNFDVIGIEMSVEQMHSS